MVQNMISQSTAGLARGRAYLCDSLLLRVF